MDTFERNYWSLYLDFLEDFKELNYKGHSIPHLCHYRSLIRSNKELMKMMDQDTLVLKKQVNDSKEIQELFNRYKALYVNPERKQEKGKIVLHDVYNLLRFPKDFFSKYLSNEKVMLLKESQRNTKKPANAKDPKNAKKEKTANNTKNTKNKSTPKKLKKKRGKSSTASTSITGRKINKLRRKASSPNPMIQHEYFDKYKVNNEDTITEIKSIALNLIDSFTNHPVYSHPIFKTRFFIQIETIINRIEEARNLFEQESVSSIIVPSTHYPESRTLVMIAAEYGIPTICMQHGIISSEFGYLPKMADIDAVYGQFEVDWYKEKGIEESQLEIIGHPRFDLIEKTPNLNKETLIQKLGMDPHKKTILVIVRGNAQLDQWDRFLGTLPMKEKFNVIVKDFPDTKPHPLTTTHSYTLPSKGCQLYDLIHLSDGVVSYSSTVALEAMLAKKPVFILNEPFSGYVGYFNKLSDLVKQKPEHLAELVSLFFKSDPFQDLTFEKIHTFLPYAYKNNLPSGQRLADLVKKLSL